MVSVTCTQDDLTSGRLAEVTLKDIADVSFLHLLGLDALVHTQICLVTRNTLERGMH